MKNWKEYVGYMNIPSTEDGVELDTFSVYYVAATKPSEQQVERQKTLAEQRGEEYHETKCIISIFQEKLDTSEITMTEEEMSEVVENLIETFPIVKSENSVDLERQKINVAKNTFRGPANINFKNSWYYKGSSQHDAPIIVTQYKEKYHVFQHPNFNSYGFNVGQ